MNHTPGPWEAYHVLSAGWSVRMAKPRDGYDKPDPVCSMAWWQFDKPGIIDDSISGANARLIAASPELLDACQAMIDAFEYTGTRLVGAEYEAKEKILKAIKKATEGV